MEVEALLGRVEEVCALPAHAQRVMELSASNTAKIEEVAEAIAADAGLTAEVMRLANSPVYGRPRGIDTLEQAVLLLGLQEIHDMATAMAMLAAFASKHELSHTVHHRAVIGGAIGRAVARALRAPRSIAFLTSLLSDIGAMACLAVDGEGYAQILYETDGNLERRTKMELQRYGVTSVFVGSELLRRNGLPDIVTDAVAGRGDEALAATTSFARRIAPAVLRAAESQDVSGFEEEVDAAAQASGLEMATESLLECCLQGAATAGRALSH